MKPIIITAALLPLANAFATPHFPVLEVGDSLCYVRVYTAQEILQDATHTYEGNAQRVKGISFSIEKTSKKAALASETVIRGMDGQDYYGEGIAKNADDTLALELNQLSLFYNNLGTAPGVFIIKQMQDDLNSILLKFKTPSKFINDQQSDQSMIIQSGDSDAFMRLHLIEVDPRSKEYTCAAMMKQQVEESRK